MGEMRFQAGRMERGVGSWSKQEDERDRKWNDSCCSLQRRMCRCSAKCDSLSNQMHPLPLFLLATALWHLYTDILDAAIQIQKCAAGQQMQYKVFSCVLHLQQACARDATHPARNLSIPDSSGSHLSILLTLCVSFSFWTQPHDRLEHTHLSITELVVSWYGILSGWTQC